jgi:vitamin B12 transporter
VGAEDIMQKLLLNSILLAGSSLSFPTLAIDDNRPPSLAETVVTATRTETARDELATATSVFNREDIDGLQVKSLPELLKRASGIDLTQNGGYGTTSSIFMRGTNSDHVLVLIDGIKVGSVTLGTTPFEIIPLDQIERVEITRGPNSSLYGSEAVGGVIQIFTRKGKQNTVPSISLKAGAGSFDTAQGAGSISGKWQNTWYSLSASHFNSQGINARQGRDPDRDAYYNTGLNARIGHQFDNAELEAFYLFSEGRTDIDSFQNGARNLMEFTNQVVGINGSVNFNDYWHSSLRLGESRDDSTSLYPTRLFDSYFNSTRWNVSWLNDMQLGDDHKLTIGSDYRLDQIDSNTHYLQKERYDVGVFGELHSRILENHFLNASLRWDKNQAFGDYVTGNFGWRFNSAYGVSAFASVGNAFKAPTLNDLYYSDLWGNHGNPNLKPEESLSFEIGLAGRHSWANWELRAYHTNIDNLITWVTDTNTFISTPLQTQKAQIDGIEFEISGEILGWQNKLNCEFLRPQDRASNQTLPRRAGTIVRYDVSRSIGKFDLGGNILARGNSFEQDWLNNRTRVGGFVTIDLRIAYHINKNWMLSAKLNNLLDKQYQTVDTYNTFGRNFFFTVDFNL